MTVVFVHPMARRATEERVACFMASLTCGAIQHAFIGLVYVNAATRDERCWS